MEIIDFISIASGIISITVGVLAIWISLLHKRDADNTNQRTFGLLKEIETQANVLTQIAMPELKAYGEAARQHVFRKVSDTPASDPSIKTEEFLLKLNNLENKESKEIASISKSLQEDIKKLETGLSKKKEVVKDSFYIDFTEIEFGKLEVALSKWDTFVEFLNSLWRTYLSDKFEMFSYGKEWVLIDLETEEQIAPKTHHYDQRSLEDVGIYPGAVLQLKDL